MKKSIKVSEIFGPAGYWNFNVDHENGLTTNEFVERWGVTQGEGKFVGVRSTFIRVFGCNLTCPSFGLTHGDKTDEPDVFAKTIHLYKNISETPAAQFGCDSYFSWHPGFKSLSPKLDIETIAKMALQSSGGALQSNKFSPIHLIFTGGEPMMPGWQKMYLDLIDKIVELDSSITNKIDVTFETNGTQPIKDMQLFKELAQKCNITWSISPKLSASGHSHDETLFPNVINQYCKISSDVYLKFVAQTVSDLDEIGVFYQQYKEQCNRDFMVYVMPEGGTPSEYRKHSTLELTSAAVKRGYNITPRLQVLIGENITGW